MDSPKSGLSLLLIQDNKENFDKKENNIEKSNIKSTTKETFVCKNCKVKVVTGYSNIEEIWCSKDCKSSYLYIKSRCMLISTC